MLALKTMLLLINSTQVNDQYPPLLSLITMVITTHTQTHDQQLDLDLTVFMSCWSAGGDPNDPPSNHKTQTQVSIRPNPKEPAVQVYTNTLYCQKNLINLKETH